MRLPFVSPRDYFIEPLRPDDSAAIADVHAEDFSRPWSDDEFAALMDQDAVFGFAARQVGRPGQPLAGFVLSRLAAGDSRTTGPTSDSLSDPTTLRVDWPPWIRTPRPSSSGSMLRSRPADSH